MTRHRCFGCGKMSCPCESKTENLDDCELCGKCKHIRVDLKFDSRIDYGEPDDDFSLLYGELSHLSEPIENRPEKRHDDYSTQGNFF